MRTARTSVSALALLLAMAATSTAQDSLEQKLEHKLKEPFVSNAAWILDYAEAMKKAKAENKVIFAYFTRSYSP
ncbi:MAG TPA: hypothetical protein VFY93_09420 [Planctomycetota bacterium]|nr:hypothetical protein [Planctomycetota bacterium]